MQAGARGRCTTQADIEVCTWLGGCLLIGPVASLLTMCVGLVLLLQQCMYVFAPLAMANMHACAQVLTHVGGAGKLDSSRPLTLAVLGWLLPTPPASAPSLLASSAFALAVSGYSEFAALPAPMCACFMLRSQLAAVHCDARL